MNYNYILARRRNTLVLPDFTPETQPNNSLAMTFQSEVMGLGYILGEDLMAYIKLMPETILVPWTEQVLEVLRNLKGVRPGVTWKPLFPKFPKEILGEDEASLVAIATEHYESDGTWTPECEDAEFPVPVRDEKYIVLHKGEKADVDAIMQNVMASSAPFGPAELEELDWFFKKSGANAVGAIPDSVPCKENVVTLCRLLRDIGFPNSVYGALIKTPTDVLRVMCGFNNGDITLKMPTKFRNMKRSDRKFVLAQLERMASRSTFMEDMNTYANRWIRLGEAVHPGEFSKQYPKAYEAFTKLRSGAKVKTYNTQLEAALEQKDEDTFIKLLTSRPGIFARRLDHAIRQATNPQKVVDAFRGVSAKVPTTVLLQLREYFAHRNENTDMRVFFPKGNVSRSYVKDGTVEALPQKITDGVVNACTIGLLSQYATRPGLGDVYVSPEMKNYTVPNGTRTAAKALKTVSRGSCFPITDDVKVLRPFVYWMNGHDRVDIDLSVVLMDENFGVQSQVAYYGLKDPNGIYHSGDITNAPNGAAEFIDIVMDSAAKAYRYATVVITSFTSQHFKDLPMCFGGWMTRSEPQSGEAFEPTTVDNRFDLSGDKTTDLVVVVDLRERKIYWADLACDSSMMSLSPRRSVSARDHLTGLAAASKSIVEGHKPNLYDMFVLNAQARGRLVDKPEDADVVISTDETATVRPTDTDIITAEWL